MAARIAKACQTHMRGGKGGTFPEIPEMHRQISMIVSLATFATITQFPVMMSCLNSGMVPGLLD
jgi:hypothetical protein